MSSQMTTAAIGTDDLGRDAGEPECGADPDELPDADPEVRDQHRDGGEGRPADAVLLADQLREALAGDRAHARRHLLHHDQQTVISTIIQIRS